MADDCLRERPSVTCMNVRQPAVAEDIVTRLRAIALRCWCAEKSQGEPVGKPFFRCETCDDQLRAADEVERLRAVVDALLARPFRGTPLERRDRLYGSDWETVHDALDALEARRG